MMDSQSEHESAIDAAFSTQAATFVDPQLNVAFTSRLDELVAAISPAAEDICLDVAAGTGLVARALAPHVRSAIALDATAAMLDAGRAEAAAEGTDNVVFMHGLADDLPFVDQSFSLVVTRYSLHHLIDAAPAVAELARVCRDGGRVVICDMLSDEDAAVAATQNRIERERDPSHSRMLTQAEIAELLAANGLRLESFDVARVVRPVALWLEQSRTPQDVREQIADQLGGMIGSGETRGLAPSIVEDALHFTQYMGTAVASK